jgi:hypothetical protein
MAQASYEEDVCLLMCLFESLLLQESVLVLLQRKLFSAAGDELPCLLAPHFVFSA